MVSWVHLTSLFRVLRTVVVRGFGGRTGAPGGCGRRESMSFGLLWSVTAAGAIVFAAPYLLRPSSDGPAEVGDRFAASVALGAALGILAAEVLSARRGLQMPSRTATDVGFWVAACAGAAIYAGRAKRRAFVTATARVADVVPWVLLAYGAYLALCWLRSTCAAIRGHSTEWRWRRNHCGHRLDGRRRDPSSGVATGRTSPGRGSHRGRRHCSDRAGVAACPRR